MTDLLDVELVRPALVLLCRDPLKRVTAWNLDEPNRWRPATVRDPDTLMFFSDDGAWGFIADSLYSGVAVTCLPPNIDYPDFAYYFLKDCGGAKRIYAKIALNTKVAKIIGVSFHYEDPR